jgi:hypothetical protein
MLKVVFCLLVLLTPVDDAWARATPDPGDDAWAAENNEFLAPAARDTAPLPLQPAPGPVRLDDATPHQPATADPTRSTVVRPARLYLLMSLQR